MKAAAAVLLRASVVVVLLWASVLAIRLAIADAAFLTHTPEGTEKAVQWAPGNATYHRTLGVVFLGRDPARSEREFREAMRLNPWDSQARMHLAVLLESQGHIPEAEREFLGAAKFDATYMPRWDLANFEFRRGQIDKFWIWARKAAAMSYGDRFALYDLAAATGESNLAERLDLKGDDLWTTYLQWSILKGTPNEIHHAALAVAATRKQAVSSTVQQAAARLLDLAQVNAALEVWNAGVKAGIVPAGEAARGKITNHSFASTPTGSGFDWIVSKPGGGAIVRERAQGGLRIRFTGDQAEQCDLLSQRVAVEPGTSYRVSTRYHTEGVGQQSGLKWLVSSLPNNQLSLMDDYLSDGGSGEAAVTFSVPAGIEWVQLVLRYQRPPGEVRIAGEVSVFSVEMARL